MDNLERSTTQLDMIHSYVKLYPEADSYSISLFAEKIGLTMLTSYEPNNNRIPEKMSFARIVYKDRKSREINKEESYAIDWQRA